MRARTGTIVIKPSGYFARVWVGQERKFISLKTKDRAEAEHKLAELAESIATGSVPLKDRTKRPWHPSRRAQAKRLVGLAARLLGGIDRLLEFIGTEYDLMDDN
jgi:hypothetical protein